MGERVMLGECPGACLSKRLVERLRKHFGEYFEECLGEYFGERLCGCFVKCLVFFYRS